MGSQQSPDARQEYALQRSHDMTKDTHNKLMVEPYFRTLNSNNNVQTLLASNLIWGL